MGGVSGGRSSCPPSAIASYEPAGPTARASAVTALAPRIAKFKHPAEEEEGGGCRGIFCCLMLVRKPTLFLTMSALDSSDLPRGHFHFSPFRAELR